MLDRFVVGRVSRISPEAPVPVVQFQTEHACACRRRGQRGPQHHRARRRRVSLVGLVGRDAGAALRRARSCLALEPTPAGCVEDSRPADTPKKVRIVTETLEPAGGARRLRTGWRRVGAARSRSCVDRIRRLGTSAKALLVSDYLKGAVTRRVIEALIRLKNGARRSWSTPRFHPDVLTRARRSSRRTTARRRRPRIAGSGATRRRDEAALDFRARAACEGVLITRGEQGMWLLDPGGEGRHPLDRARMSGRRPARATRSPPRWRWRSPPARR